VSPTLRRVWLWLGVALLAGALLGAPYAAHMFAQGALGREHSPMYRAIVAFLSVLIFEWPLAAAGLVLARRLGLGAPLLEAWVEHRPFDARRTLMPAALWGALSGGAMLGFFSLFSGSLEKIFPPTLSPPPWWAGALGAISAGIGEETMLRLFLLSALAVPLAMRLPRTSALWTANVLAALAFGALHFGNVIALGIPFTPLLVTMVLVLNGGVGVLWGWIYTTRGLEAAIVSHVACDLVLHGLGAALGGSGRA
jgi:hypothetical protein